MTGSVRLSACERVVVAVSTGREKHAIEEAAKLAQLTRSELLAIFVEDVDLLNLAAIPFSVQITTSGERQPLEALGLEREMKAMADAARIEIDRIARAMGIPWRLEVIRGAPKAALQRSTGEKDILVAASTGEEYAEEEETGLGSLVLSARLARRNGPIVVITAPGEQGDWVVRQAAEIAHSRDKPLLVLCMNCVAQGLDHYKKIAQEEMGHNGRIEFTALEHFDVSEVATQIGRMGGSLVLASPIPEIGLSRRSAGRLADLLGVPVLLLR